MILWLAFHPGWNGHQTRDQVVLLTPIRGGWWSVMVSPGAPTTIHVTSTACLLHLCCIILVLSHAHCLLSHIIWYEIQYFWTNLYQGCFFAGIGSFISGWSWLLSDGMKVQKAGVIIAKQSIIPTLLLGTSCATLQFCSTAPVISFGFKAAERVWNAEQWSAAKRQWYQFLLTCNDNPSFF